MKTLTTIVALVDLAGCLDMLSETDIQRYRFLPGLYPDQLAWEIPP